MGDDHEAPNPPETLRAQLMRSFELGMMYSGASLAVRILMTLGYSHYVEGRGLVDGDCILGLLVWLVGYGAPYFLAIVAMVIAACLTPVGRARGRMLVMSLGVALGLAVIAVALPTNLDGVSLPVLVAYWAPALLLCVGGTLLVWALVRRLAVAGIAAGVVMIAALACTVGILSADPSGAGVILWLAATLDVTILGVVVVPPGAFLAALLVRRARLTRQERLAVGLDPQRRPH